jgi:hypothetical protein
MWIFVLSTISNVKMDLARKTMMIAETQFAIVIYLINVKMGNALKLLLNVTQLSPHALSIFLLNA